jgi:aminoglycoside phosphotransferase (APT) family kinase protein
VSFCPHSIVEHLTQRTERFCVYSEMARVLAALHRVDIEAAGLQGFGKRSGGSCRRQLSTWSAQYQAVVQRGALSASPSLPSSSSSNAHKALISPSLEQLMQQLTAMLPSLADEVTLSHGDFRLDNLIFHPSEPRVVAVLDWELSTLGHPLSDLAYLCMMFHNPANKPSHKSSSSSSSSSSSPSPPNPFAGLAGVPSKQLIARGIPSEPQFLLAYTRAADRGPITDWQFHLGLSYFRASAILHGVLDRAMKV